MATILVHKPHERTHHWLKGLWTSPCQEMAYELRQYHKWAVQVRQSETSAATTPPEPSSPETSRSLRWEASEVESPGALLDLAWWPRAGDIKLP